MCWPGGKLHQARGDPGKTVTFYTSQGRFRKGMCGLGQEGSDVSWEAQGEGDIPAGRRSGAGRMWRDGSLPHESQCKNEFLF